MCQLNDEGIRERIKKNELVKDFAAIAASAENKQIQPASFDMTAGKIYSVPPDEADRYQGSFQAVSEYTLKPGETVLVESKEELKVPTDIAGLGSVPSSLSIRGLLMVSPGHIDPGYDGTLLFTLINVSRNDITITTGEAIFTTVWFKLEKVASKSYTQLQTEAKAAGKGSGGDRIGRYLRVLSRDFMDVENRAKKIANHIIISGGIVGVIIALVVSVGPSWLALSSDQVKHLETLSEDVAALKVEQSSIDSVKLQKKFDEMQTQIQQLQNQLSAMQPHKKPKP